MRRCLIALGLLLVSAAVEAQNPQIDTGTITAVSSGGACSAAPAGCAVITIPNGLINSVTLQISGTFTATLLFEATSNGTNWNTITGINLADGSSATGATATGSFSFQNSGLVGIRARCTAFTSGTATITAVRGYASARWLTPFFTTVSATTVSGTNVYATNFCLDKTSQDACLIRDAANALAVQNSDTPQAFRIYGSRSGNTYLSLVHDGSNGTISMFNGGALILGTWQVNGNNWLATTDNLGSIGATGANRPSAYYKLGLTKAASVAAGGTINLDSDLTRTRYQVTIAPATGDCSTAFIAAALTADCTIATLPAGMKLVGVYADVTVGLTCSGTCTGTKVMQAGTAAGGTQILAASLNVAATGTFGLADADLGSGMTRAAAIQGGLIGSWSATTPVSVRFTSGTGNWGSGAATFVNAGSVKFTLITEQVK